MKLTGKIISIGRHNRDGEPIDGVLIEVPREQLQQGGILYREVSIYERGEINTERKAVQAMIAAGDRLDTLLRCETGIEDSEEWACATREQQLAMIAEGWREWRKRREG
jgi:hypothetical protein